MKREEVVEAFNAAKPPRVTLLGKLICAVTRKHRRGKRISENAIGGKAMFECPRCGANWLRKVKANAAAAA